MDAHTWGTWGISTAGNPFSMHNSSIIIFNQTAEAVACKSAALSDKTGEGGPDSSSSSGATTGLLSET
jgi:hypothetical protein